MRRALRMEWTKMCTDPGARWWVLALCLATATGGALAVGAVDATDCAPRPCTLDATRISLGGVWIGQIAVVALAVLVVSGEYESMLVRSTLAAVPCRVRVVAAKASVVVAAVLGSGLATMAATLVTTRLVLPTRGFTSANGYPDVLSPTAEPTLRAYLGSVLYLALVALLGIGIALVVRNTGTAIGTTLGLLLGAPIATLVVTDPAWQNRIRRYSPMTAGLSIQDTTAAGSHAIGPWAGLGVLALYAGSAVVIGTLLFRHRDA